MVNWYLARCFNGMDGSAYIAPLKNTREIPIFPRHESCKFQIIGRGNSIMKRSENIFNELNIRFAVLKLTQ